MNDPRSMVSLFSVLTSGDFGLTRQYKMIGWGALLFAAGSGYYFARKDLNERRREQARQGLRGPAMDWREKIEQNSDALQSASGTKNSATPSSGSKVVPTPNPKEPPEGKPS
ncbi:uncharacterized protein FOMMEDRAFT_162603 [Fomitiporia mediterranea MF3/22]|uniref:Uncharacterized protein n=1 Tax=Fomitiporia mediterranea (strain MF3/22) TaxID=694068 RepID=R7SJM6_FOMME|nr:uncharacterized protein FOMMEDRAFT_162603 [Fomitiporia mediterranea MF3/22]EJC97784.1 hypothetical protein FOMMEDRAFT_162603 [Fomitiporia mediterranea MF3/22]